jgi:hypothetical protein
VGFGYPNGPDAPSLVAPSGIGYTVISPGNLDLCRDLRLLSLGRQDHASGSGDESWCPVPAVARVTVQVRPCAHSFEDAIGVHWRPDRTCHPFLSGAQDAMQTADPGAEVGHSCAPVPDHVRGAATIWIFRSVSVEVFSIPCGTPAGTKMHSPVATGTRRPSMIM